MDENLAWKVVYAAAIFSLLVLGLAYYLISPREATFFSPERQEKIAEFSNTKIEGRKEGKKAWEFAAKSGWTEKDGFNTYLTKVERGKIYSDGKLTVRDLVAARVKIDRRAEIIEASGGVAMQTREGKIFADRASIYRAAKRMVLADRVRIVPANGSALTATSEYLSEPEQLNADNGIRLELKEGKIKTLVQADRAILYLAVDKDIPLSGGLEVAQGKKMAVADTGLYSRKQNVLQLKGRTRTVMEKAETLLKAETAAKLRRPDIKDILREKTVVTADEIFFSTKTGDARAAGSVEVTQKGREAKADSAVYDDKHELLTLTGNVFMKKGEDWLSARQVIVSIGKETFEAAEVKEAKFKL